MDQERTDRIQAELKAIEELKKSSPIFDFVVEGDSVEKITFTFNGKGVRLKEGSNKETEFLDIHQIEVLFGVASFHGTDAQALAAPLSLLHHRHLAPEDGPRPRRNATTGRSNDS